MDILYLLIPMSVALVFVIAAVFWWSVKNNQYEDMEGPAYRILMDDDHPSERVEDCPSPAPDNHDRLT